MSPNEVPVVRCAAARRVLHRDVAPHTSLAGLCVEVRSTLAGTNNVLSPERLDRALFLLALAEETWEETPPEADLAVVAFDRAVLALVRATLALRRPNPPVRVGEGDGGAY